MVDGTSGVGYSNIENKAAHKCDWVAEAYIKRLTKDKPFHPSSQPI
jgi:hypothetical protein